MVKLIIDLLGSSLPDEISKLKNTIILMPQNCQLPASAIPNFKDLTDLESPLNIGNFMLKTNDDCLRGLVIGRITEKFPKVLIYSSRPEIISKYLQTIHVEPWPNDFDSYNKIDNFTMQGPPVYGEVNENPQKEIAPKEIPKFLIQAKNEPKIPVRSGLNEKINPTGLGYPAVASGQGSHLLQSSNFSQGINTQPLKPGYSNNPFGNPNQGKPVVFNSAAINNPLPKPEGQNVYGFNLNSNQVKPQSLYLPENKNLKSKIFLYEQDLDSKEEEPISSNHEIIVKYIDKVLENFLLFPENKSIKTYRELYTMVTRIIRGMGEQNEEIIDDDRIRLKLTDEVCFKILDFGFFVKNGSLTSREIVDERAWITQITYNDN